MALNSYCSSPKGLGLRDVAQVHDVHPEGAETAVADVAPVFDPLRDADGSVISAPGGVITGKDVFLVLLFLSETLSRNPPPAKLP